MTDDTALCARCDHEYEGHDRRDGHCLVDDGDASAGARWECECPRFVWSDDVFSVEVSS